MRNVAILGSASSSSLQAPTENAQWEIWAMGLENRRVHRYFEMHEKNRIRPECREKFKTTLAKVYMRDVHEDFPTSVKFPMEEVVKDLGIDYFASSIAYMLALAIHENVEQIGIWGVDLINGDEYKAQRPNLEYLIGLAQGRGLKVYVPERSALLKLRAQYGTPEEKLDPGLLAINPAICEAWIKDIQAQRKSCAEQMLKLQHTGIYLEGREEQMKLMHSYLMNFIENKGIIPGG